MPTLYRAFIAGVAITLLGCSVQRATEQDCQAIFDRLVTLELEEMGFRDPTLLRIRQQEFSQRYQGEIARCVGRPLPEGALACIGTAASAEELSHRCLE